MKFHIELLNLWLTGDRTRSITFLPNKVNIITGDSHTGKTAILDIFDYCMFASKHRISESIINESVLWYGLRMHVNDKVFTLARRAPAGTTVSADYYFSAVGDVPEAAPVANIQEGALKLLLSAEFGIDQDVQVPFGGSVLRSGSRISLRYFLMFNTISQDIITHSDQFFDKQDQDRYREALPRVFDIAVGIETVENILKREKSGELRQRLTRLLKLAAKTSEKREVFVSQLAETIATARGFGLVPDSMDGDASVELLERIVTEPTAGDHVSTRYEAVSAELYRVTRKIRGLKKFGAEYGNHKATLAETRDSLKPIKHLLDNYEETVRTSVFEDIIRNLSEGLTKIKAATANKTPMDSNIAEIIKDLEAQKKKLNEELESLPEEIDGFGTERDKYIFIGEMKAKLELFADADKSSATDYKAEIADLESQIEELAVPNAIERQDQFTKVLDEAIQDYIAITKVALGNYGEYRSAFDYAAKKLHLRKPKSLTVENVGSSSNHMFLHLFMFLGLHELVMRSDSPHVAPLLIVDQFSRPYWGDDQADVNQSDVAKVKLALKLLDGFIKLANEMGKEFQMIIFEHVNAPYWEGLENVHLVEEFREGNALIPMGE
ncbi:DUF3732 domain-containing protein [Rhizobium leguminosarum]|uniref:DUF3732 domain-containing protein n=1 Tax=Rhizobium leguminosarum TaxID=384 RepID=UPI001C926BB7|nr:DUF3732 domain-containing protein [Rhizobium leguminosarum]MBY2996201.1 DUF3732 domain-containing protein [Rhizobium leguminosarum]MBY3060023.1 DUF3732 domain-containing protein [Rhizobium leguminosarum]